MAKAVDKAYQTVRERILRGVYPASMRITEQEVAAAAGVSRTPVREALRKLHAEGLLEFTPHQGAIVTGWTREDRDEVFELRALLEAYGAAHAARKMTGAGITELRRLAENQYYETLSKTAGYLERIGELNSRFHRLIHEFSGSSHLVNALNALIEAPVLMKTFEMYHEEDLIRSASHHMEIVRALEARDSEWSASLMRSHILGARGALRLNPTSAAHPLPRNEAPNPLRTMQATPTDPRESLAPLQTTPRAGRDASEGWCPPVTASGHGTDYP